MRTKTLLATASMLAGIALALPAAAQISGTGGTTNGSSVSSVPAGGTAASSVSSVSSTTPTGLPATGGGGMAR